MNHLGIKEAAEPVAAVPVFALEAKADGDRVTVEGYGSVFGALDRGFDLVEPGAFKESIARHKAAGTAPAMLWQHDPGQPIGVWHDVKEDSRGLFLRGEILSELAKGAEAAALLRAKAIKGLSIGYRTIEADRDDETGIRRLLKLDLWEVSVVTFPMNPAAGVTAVKGDPLADALLKRAVETSLAGMAGISRKDARAAAAAACDRIRAEREAGALDLSSLRDALAAWPG